MGQHDAANRVRRQLERELARESERARVEPSAASRSATDRPTWSNATRILDGSIAYRLDNRLQLTPDAPADPPRRLRGRGPPCATCTRFVGRRPAAGPFFAMEHIVFDEVTYRGEPAVYDHSSAFGQWGPMLVELTQVHDAQPTGPARGAGRARRRRRARGVAGRLARGRGGTARGTRASRRSTPAAPGPRPRCGSTAASCSVTRSRCSSAATSCSASTRWCATRRSDGTARSRCGS